MRGHAPEEEDNYDAGIFNADEYDDLEIPENAQRAISSLIQVGAYAMLVITLFGGFNSLITANNYYIGTFLIFAAGSMLVIGGMRLVVSDNDSIIRTGTVISLVGFMILTIAAIMMWADATDFLSIPQIRWVFYLNSGIYGACILIILVLGSFVCKEEDEEYENNAGGTHIMRAWRQPRN